VDVFDVNVAVTLAFPVIVNVVGLAVVLEKLPPLPDHPENVYPAGGFAVRLIGVFGLYPPPVQF
jgi:hypothetical protein